MEFLNDYGLFLAKTLSFALVVLLSFSAILSLRARGKETGEEPITIKKLNDYYRDLTQQLKQAVVPKKEFKQYVKAQKQAEKNVDPNRKRIYVLDFIGNIRAEAVNALRKEVTAVLQVATPQDEVVVRLESPGGMVSNYGLGASQLKRIRSRNIPLTVCVDKVAASGGYLMACVANKILAAPFAIIGSVGVVTQFPNFYRYLQKHNIDFEQVTAGKYKRTMTMFGNNSEEAREKLQHDLNDIHRQFKEFIVEHRSQVDIDKIATGEYWLAKQAQDDYQLVDMIITSDDYLLEACHEADVYQITQSKKKSWPEKVKGGATAAWDQICHTLNRGHQAS
jgi:serine protease SohB